MRSQKAVNTSEGFVARAPGWIAVLFFLFTPFVERMLNNGSGTLRTGVSPSAGLSTGFVRGVLHLAELRPVSWMDALQIVGYSLVTS